MTLTITPTKLLFMTAIVFMSSMLLAKSNHSPSRDKSQHRVHKSVSAINKKTTKPKKVRTPVTYKSDERIRMTAKDKACLTRNVYHEARGEPYAGKLAVAQVTWNRKISRQWGTSLCNVVYAPSQFSWTADPNKRFKSPRNLDWLTSEKIVADYGQGLRVSTLEDAQYFHAKHLGRPHWTRHLKKRAAIGNHVFYD